MSVSTILCVSTIFMSEYNFYECEYNFYECEYNFYESTIL